MIFRFKIEQVINSNSLSIYTPAKTGRNHETIIHTIILHTVTAKHYGEKYVHIVECEHNRNIYT